MKKASIFLGVAALGLCLSLQAYADGGVAAGKAKSATCAACHGVDGNSQSAMFPKLAGQNQDYLLHSLKAYKSGTRKIPIMSAQVAGLSATDMEDLAAYFAAQSGLVVKY
jgi:cytochrome c553